jgi:hypothetical protein
MVESAGVDNRLSAISGARIILLATCNVVILQKSKSNGILESVLRFEVLPRDK